MSRTALFLVLFGVAASAGFADTLELRDGRVIDGTYLGGSSRQIRMEVGDKIETFSVDDVKGLKFGTPKAPAVSLAPAPPARRDPEERPKLMRPDPIEPAVQKAAADASAVELPAGTAVTVRLIDPIDSEVNALGQTFQASVDEPVVVNGETVIPRGADAVVKLVEDKQSGKIQGKTELTTVLVSLKANDQLIDTTSGEVTTASGSRTAKSGKVIGGTAAVGAILGGIFGGGKGAAIGAISGAGAGTAVQVMTNGEKVRIPSETRMTYTLANPIKVPAAQ